VANPDHIAVIAKGVEAWNGWRRDNPDVVPDLAGAFFVQAQLAGANLEAANLDEARLSQANLSDADLTMAHLSAADLDEAVLHRAKLHGANLGTANLLLANLREADLSGAVLYLANMLGADLSGADLTRAGLIQTNLNHVDLRDAKMCEAMLFGALFSPRACSGADLTGARLGNTIFADVDLHGVLGLDVTVHNGPSTIGFDTFYRSRGALSDTFMKATGASDSLLRALATSDDSPPPYYSCFISYSGSDERFARKLYRDLQQSGVRCWFAPEDIKVGDSFGQTIEQSLRKHEKILIVLSRASIKSRWVQREFESAMEREAREESQLLFPIRIDDEIMRTDTAWASHIRQTRQIGDFSTWSRGRKYSTALRRLLRDLSKDA
jgi:hypothetical protein